MSEGIAMNRPVIRTALGSLMAACLMTAAIAPAAAQSFGGMPTITPQDRAKAKARAAAKQEELEKDKRLPRYVVVDQGGYAADQDVQSYSSIQDAIDNVAWGGVVVVRPGIYFEDLELTRSVRIEGQGSGPSRPRILPVKRTKAATGENGLVDGSCVRFDPELPSEHVQIENVSFEPAWMQTDRSLIALYQDRFGGSVVMASEGLTEPCVDVRRGIFSMVGAAVDGAGHHNGELVKLAGGMALLEKNRVSGGRMGIAVSQTQPAWDRAVLIDNIVSNNYHQGVSLDGSASMLATGNLINTNGVGLSYSGSGPATLVGNKILDNASHGVLLEENAREVLVRLNQIWSNRGDGIKVINSGGLIEDNDIDGNSGVEVSTLGHLNSVPTIINDVQANTASPAPVNRRQRNGIIDWQVGNRDTDTAVMTGAPVNRR
ncbi:surface layer protein B [Parvularcula bermudensis HTCC2503]|uniref:Surface layer protein B n=2 Tax=Parvularcula TaxID=208215 RepID=E0TEV8_PARBH|nr:surface layer protein B [Parvularcula bermudensis HTCC2503]